MIAAAPVTPEAWAEARREAVATIPELVGSLALPDALLPYQQACVAALEAGTQVLVIEKSRRIGLTWGLAAYAVLRAARAKSAGGMDAMYISYAREMTREFIDACAMWARAFALAAAEVEETLFDDADPAAPDETRRIQAFRIRFASGFEVLALSSAPRTLRGKQGVVIVDEAAFVDQLAELLKAALAFLMWGGQVVVCSTHDGADNPFAGLVNDIRAGRKPYRLMSIDFDRALRDGLHRRICLVSRRAWSPEAEAAWRGEIVDFYGDGADEELFCIPAQGSGAWLSAALIEARMTLPAEAAPVLRLTLPPDFLQRGEVERLKLTAGFLLDLSFALRGIDRERLHALGYDPARKADPAVATLLEIGGDLTRRAALTVEMRGVPFAEQHVIMSTIIAAAPRLIGVAVDATGVGMQLAEDLGRRFGLREQPEEAGLVWAVNLSVAWYNEHMPPLKAAFEDGTIQLARDDEHLGDLRMVKLVRGVPSIPPQRESAEGGGKGARRHGDFAVALALAHAASRLQWSEYGYRAAAAASARRGTSRLVDLPDDPDLTSTRPPWRPPLGARLRGVL